MAESYVYIDAPTLDNADQSKFIVNDDFQYVQAGDSSKGSTAQFPLYKKFVGSDWRNVISSNSLPRTDFKPGTWALSGDINEGGDYITGNTAQIHISNFIVGKLDKLRFRFFEKSESSDSYTEISNNGYENIPEVYILESKTVDGLDIDNYRLVAIANNNESEPNIYELDRDFFITAKNIITNNYRLVFVFAPSGSDIVIDENTDYSFTNLRAHAGSEEKRVGLRSVPRGSFDNKSYICCNGDNTSGIASGQNRLLDFDYYIDNDLIEEYLGGASSRHHLSALDIEGLKCLKYSAPFISSVDYERKSTSAEKIFISHESLSRNGIFAITDEQIMALQIPFTSTRDSTKYEDGQTMIDQQFNTNVDGLWHTNRVIWIWQGDGEPRDISDSDETNRSNGWVKSNEVLSFSYFDTPTTYNVTFGTNGIPYEGKGIWITAEKPSTESDRKNTLAVHYYENNSNKKYCYNSADKIYSTATGEGFSATANIKVIFNYKLKNEWFDYIESIDYRNSKNWNIIQDGSGAFTTSLEDLPSSMPSLTVATGMFEGNTAITEFNIKVPNLVIADNMFSGCTNLTTIDSSFQNVVSATNMFEGCPLTSIKLTQPGFANLTEAATYTTDETTNKTTKEKGLFDSAKETLVAATVSMPSLINGTELFRDFTALESYTGDLSSLTNGRWMFGNTALSAWNNDIPKLKNGYAMFFNCKNLTSFEEDMPLLESCPFMFSKTSSLTSFTGSLESLVDSYAMFNGEGDEISAIETFNSDLSSLQSGHFMFYRCKNLTTFNIKDNDLSNLIFAKHMFASCESLTEFRCDLPNVGSYESEYYDPTEKRTFYKHEAATAMFQNCTSLITVVSDLSSITNGDMLFFGCTNLQIVDCDFSSMTDHGNMFRGCTSLRTVNANMSSLTNGSSLFSGLTSLESFTGDLSSLTTATSMFMGCAALETFNNDLPELTIANDMFKNCTALSEVNGSFAKLTNGNGMFMGCAALKNINCDFSSLTLTSNTFSGCTSLETVNANMSSLTNGSSLFSGVTSLESFIGDFSSLTDTNNMFKGCGSLRIFEADLTSLTSGDGLFSGLALERFIGNVYSLTSGARMFNGCKLDKDSVLGIINCLKTTNTCANAANLTLGINASLRNDSDILTALGISEGASSASLTGHGGGTWTITLQWNS